VTSEIEQTDSSTDDTGSVHENEIKLSKTPQRVTYEVEFEIKSSILKALHDQEYFVPFDHSHLTHQTFLSFQVSRCNDLLFCMFCCEVVRRKSFISSTL
jgi:hypothetical protein